MATTAAQLDIIFNSKGADRAKSDINDVSQSVSRAGSGFDRLKAGALGLCTALIAPMGLGLQSALQLEQGIANLNASLGGVDASTLNQLSTSIQQIGADSQFSATQVAAVADELARGGFSVEEILNGATKAVVDLSQATGADLMTSVGGITAAMNIWDPAIVGVENGLTDAAQAADIFTVAANESSADVGDIIAGMRNLGPVAGQMGIGFDEAAAAIAMMTNYGLKGADAGVSLARGLTNLADPTSEAAAKMQELGIAAFDTQGEFVGFPSLFNQLNSSMKSMDDQTKLSTLSMIFGAEAADAMALAIAAGEDPLLAIMDAMGMTGAAAEQSALRMDTLGAQFETLKEGAMTFLGSLVQGLIPGLRWLVDGANAVVDVLMKIPGPIKTIIGAIAGSLAMFAAFNVALKGLQLFNNLAGGAGLARGFRLPVGPVLAFAAAAGVAYVAYRKNFLGIRTVVDRAVKGVTNFLGNLQEAWDNTGDTASDAMQQINAWGGISPDVPNDFARALLSVGSALRSIGGENTPAWIESLGRGFESAGRFIDRFKDAWDSFSQIDMSGSDVMDQINTWGKVTNELPFAERALRAFSAAVAGGQNVSPWLLSVGEAATRMADAFATGGIVGLLDQVGREVQSLAGWAADVAIDVIVNIGQWLLGSIPEFGGWLRDQVFGYTDAAGVDHPGVLVNILDWFKGTIPDLWAKIKLWAFGGTEQVGYETIEHPGVLVNIAEWIKGTVPDLWAKVKEWALGGGTPAGDGTGGATGPQGSGSGALVQIGAVGVSIADWAVSAATDLWTKVRTFILGGGGATGAQAFDETGGVGMGREPIDLGAVPIKIAEWDVTIDFAGMWAAIDANFREQTTVGPDQIASAESAGRTIGQGLGAALGAGLSAGWGAIFGGGGGGDGTGPGPVGGGGGTSGTSGLAAQFHAFVSGMLAEVGSGMDGALSADVQSTSDDLAAWLQTTADGIIEDATSAWDTAWEALTFDAPDISLPEIEWPSLDINWEDWPLVQDIKDAIQAFKDWVTSSEVWGGGIDIPTPNINWPGGDSGGPDPYKRGVVGQDYGRSIGTSVQPYPNVGQGATTADGTRITSLPNVGTGPAAPDSSPFRELAAAAAAMTTAVSGASAALAGFGVVASGANTNLATLGTTIGTLGVTQLAGLNMGFSLLGTSLTMFGTSLTTLTTNLTTLGTTLSTLGVTQLAGLTMGFSLLGITLTTFGTSLTTVTAMVTAFGAALIAGIQTPLITATAAFVAFAATTTGMMTGWGAALTGVVTGAMAASVGAITGGMEAAVGAFVAGTGAMVGAISAGMAATVGTITGGMAAATSAVAANASMWPGIIAGVGGAMAGAGFAVGAAAGQGVAAGLLSALGAVTAAANQIIATVNNAMVSAARIASPSKMTTDIGDYMGQGVAQGLLAQQGSVTGAAVSVVTNAIAAAKDAAGIASPAKEMVPVGVYMDHGLAQGILDGQGVVINAAVQMVRSAQAAARIQAEDGSWVPESFYANNSASFEHWKELFSSGGTLLNWTQFKSQGYGAGQALGDGIAAGVRDSLQIHSPSRVLAEMGAYSAQGFLNGFDRTYTAPTMDFRTATPYSGTGSASGGGGTFAPQVTIHVDATGKDIDEEKLTDLAAEKTLRVLEILAARQDRGMGGRV